VVRVAEYGFQDVARAQANLDALRGRPVLGERLDEVLVAAGNSADPDQALNFLERLAATGCDEAALRRAHALERVILLFGASALVAESILRDPPQLAWLLRHVDRPRDPRERGGEVAPARTAEDRLSRLRMFKQRELLHVAARDLLGIATVEETLASLTLLAEVVIEQAYAVCLDTVREGSGPPPARSGFVVLGLGKLGAGELNFSSDVDLVYVYDGETLSPERYRRLGRDLTAVLSDSMGQGQLYRVDLRLRPDGRSGPLVQSLPAVETYYDVRAATWERVALIRARPVAGDRRVGRRFVEIARRFTYGRPLGAAAIDELLDLKLRLERRVDLKGHLHRNVKLGAGGIREVEMVVHTLQLRYGGGRPALQARGLLDALRALARARRLPSEKARELAEAYLFLRDVENKLQMAQGLQTHVLSDDPRQRRALAKRMGYLDAPGQSAEQLFQADLDRHTTRVRRAYERSFGAAGGG
jgi:glutamate-ammonia-ligase adenylyltransferase